MTEENAEVTVEEDKKVVPPVEEEKKSEAEEPKDDFVKDTEVVTAGKHNQALRKLREAELELRELKKQKEEAKAKPEEEEKEDDIFKDEEESKVDPEKLIDEKLKPVMDTLKKREENDKKIARAAFFEENPEFLNAERFQELMDVLDEHINPNSKADYITQLRMGASILSSKPNTVEVDEKKKDVAGDAATSGDGAEKGSIKEEFTAEDRKYQKEWGISDEGMRAYKEKLKKGDMRLLI